MDNTVLLTKIKQLLERNFGNLVARVILFGSRVDGTAREYSDYDILVVVKKTIDWNEKDAIRSVLYDLNIEYDILLSVQVISEPELNTIRGKQPFIQNALETGMTV